MSHEWRLIDSGPCSASYNMALDEAISTAVRNRKAPPTLRFYHWDRPSLSIGCFQRTSDLDLDYCRQNSIPFVRRPTGGRAILHEDELTYSFSVRTDKEPFSEGLMESYRRIGSAFTLAFRKIGIQVESKMQRERGRVLTQNPLCFESSSYGEILLNNRKIVGSAQKRWKDGLLQQGSIPYSSDKEKIGHVFGIQASQTINSINGLKEILPDFDDQKFRIAVQEAFEEVFGISLPTSHPDRAEHQFAEELEKQKYLQNSWNLRL
ncbi:MAG: biotin/lipoate A/B protein ligase family protein [Nitrospirota bacterium]|nr:biotin/lipoate A/B protein ligase family protein [Nitrospirota bacterium]